MSKFFVGLLAASVLTLLTGISAADQIVGILPDAGPYVGRTLIVTSNSEGSAPACGKLGDVYSVIVMDIERQGGKPVVTKLVVPHRSNVKRGDRFVLAAAKSCSTSHIELTLLQEET